MIDYELKISLLVLHLVELLVDSPRSMVHGLPIVLTNYVAMDCRLWTVDYGLFCCVRD